MFVVIETTIHFEKTTNPLIMSWLSSLCLIQKQLKEEDYHDKRVILSSLKKVLASLKEQSEWLVDRKEFELKQFIAKKWIVWMLESFSKIDKEKYYNFWASSSREIDWKW